MIFVILTSPTSVGTHLPISPAKNQRNTCAEVPYANVPLSSLGLWKLLSQCYDGLPYIPWLAYDLHYLFLQMLAGLAYPMSGDHLAGISRLKHIAQWCSMSLEGRMQILTSPECVDMAPSAPLGLPEHKVPVRTSWMRTLPGCWHITKYISILYVSHV